MPDPTAVVEESRAHAAVEDEYRGSRTDDSAALSAAQGGALATLPNPRQVQRLLSELPERGGMAALRSKAILQAQQVHGNHAVQRLIQAATASRTPTPEQDIAQQLADPSPGTPLDAEARLRLEHHLPADLGDVRIHADPEADALSRSLGAQAFTTGADMFFRAGAYDPSSSDGLRLLAHEATHVLQQRNAASPTQELTVSSPNDSSELAAEQVAHDFDQSSAGPSTVESVPASATVQRAPADYQHAEDGNAVAVRMQQRADEEMREHANQDGEDSNGTDGAQQQPPQIDRQQLAAKSAELQGAAKPDVDRAAEQKPLVESAAAATEQEASKPLDPTAIERDAPAAAPTPAPAPAPAPPAAAEGAGAEHAAAADAAFGLADSQPEPAPPIELTPPEPVAPIDGGGQPLPGNPDVDIEMIGLAEQAQSLREQGHQLRAQAAEARANAGIIEGNLALVRQGIAEATAGIQTASAHTAARRDVMAQAQQTLAVSQQKQRTVAEEAPTHVANSAQAKGESGPLAREAAQLASENAARTPEDSDAAARSQEQGGQMNRAGSDATNVDSALTEAHEGADTLVQDAAQAAGSNSTAEASISTTGQMLGQTEERLATMQSDTLEATADTTEIADGPSTMSAQADALDMQGQGLIDQSVEIESQLHTTQQDYASGMQAVPAEEPIEWPPADLAAGDMPPTGLLETDPGTIDRPPAASEIPSPSVVPEIPAMDGLFVPESFQDLVRSEPQTTDRVLTDDHLFNQMITALERPAEPVAGPSVTIDGAVPSNPPAAATSAPPAPAAPISPAVAAPPRPIDVGAALPSWVTGIEPPNAEQRAQAQQAEEQKRAGQVAMIREQLGGRSFDQLSEGERMRLALRMTGRNLFGSVSQIKWPGFGHLAQGLIDPRFALAGVIGGLNTIVNGTAAFFRAPSWGTALKMAADIATGLTIILGSITALAGLIIGIMTAITILSLGFAAPVTGPVIAFCATVMTTVGGWTIAVGQVALLLQGIMFLKNLYEAATAATAEELMRQSDNMTQDVSNAGNVLMQVGMAKLGQVGGRALQNQIQELGGGVRFAANLGARGLPARIVGGVQEAGGVAAYGRQVLTSAGESVAEAGGVGAFARQSVVSGARGVRNVGKEVWGALTSEAKPAMSGGLSRDFLLGTDIPRGSGFEGLMAASRETRMAVALQMRAARAARLAGTAGGSGTTTIKDPTIEVSESDIITERDADAGAGGGGGGHDSGGGGGGSSPPESSTPTPESTPGSTPRELLPGERPQARVLDPSEIARDEAITEGMNTGKRRIVMNDGRTYIFKPAEGEVPLIGEGQGINAGDRYRRAPAAANVATQAGIPTPGTEIVEYNGQIGQLQEWISSADTYTWAELQRAHPDWEAVVQGSQLKRDLDTFDYLIANMDRNPGNLLVELDPVTGEIKRLIPIDMDIAFPPTELRYTLPIGQREPWQMPLPSTISQGLESNLRHMAANQAALRHALGAYLTADEVNGTLARLQQIIQELDAGRILVQ